MGSTMMARMTGWAVGVEYWLCIGVFGLMTGELESAGKMVGQVQSGDVS